MNKCWNGYISSSWVVWANGMDLPNTATALYSIQSVRRAVGRGGCYYYYYYYSMAEKLQITLKLQLFVRDRYVSERVLNLRYAKVVTDHKSAQSGMARRYTT